jgi:hypothetical protein
LANHSGFGRKSGSPGGAAAVIEGGSPGGAAAVIEESQADELGKLIHAVELIISRLDGYLCTTNPSEEASESIREEIAHLRELATLIESIRDLTTLIDTVLGSTAGQIRNVEP